MSTYPQKPVILNVKLRTAIPLPFLKHPPATMQKYGHSSVRMQYSFDFGDWQSITEDQMDIKQPLNPTRGIGTLVQEGVLKLCTRMVYDADTGESVEGPVRTFGLWWASTDTGDSGCVFYVQEVASSSNPNPIVQIMATPQDPSTNEDQGVAACLYLDYLGNDLDNIQNQTVIVGELMIDP